MLTVWQGYGVPADNVVSTDIFVTRALRVMLQDPPQLVTRVQLTSTAHAVNLYVVESPVWYGVDTDPGPIALPSPGGSLPIATTDFRPGAILQPGHWQQCVLPLDGLAHMLHLVSETPSVVVALTMLEEAL